MKRRIISAIILVSFVLGIFAGCSRSTVTTTSTIEWESGYDTTTDGSISDSTSDSTSGDKQKPLASGGPVESNTKISNPLDADLKGATITIYSTNAMFTPDPKSSKTGAAWAEMLSKLEKKLNCKISNKTVDESTLKTSVTTSAASGKTLCDILNMKIVQTGSYILGGFVQDLRSVSTMDLSKNYMNRYDAINASSIKGKTFALALPNTSASMVFFNKRILNEIGSSDEELYGLVKNGNWTVEKLREFARTATKDLDGVSGMTTADQWGIIAVDVASMNAYDFLSKAGALLLTKDSSGNLVYNMEDPKVSSALTLLKQVFFGDGTAIQMGDAQASTYFSSGKALFFCGYTELATMIDAKDDYGVLPMPNLTAGSKEYKSGVNWNYYMLMMSSNLSKTRRDNAGAFLQAYEYLCDDVLTASYKEYKNRYFYDDTSKEMFEIAVNGKTLQTSQMLAHASDEIFAGTTEVMHQYISADKPLSAGIEASKQQGITGVNDVNKKFG